MIRLITTGKGGVGKTTIISTLCSMLARDGKKVVVFDCDPSMNLAMTLGIPYSSIRTLAEDKMAIGSAMEAHDHNADPDEVLEGHSALTSDNVRVVIMGTIPQGGSGCLCSSISLVKVLVESISNKSDAPDFIIVDSQAGPEILGRGLALSFDCNMVVTENMPKAMEVTRQVIKLSKDLKIKRILLVVNKDEGKNDIGLIQNDFGVSFDDILTIRNDPSVREADRKSVPILDDNPNSIAVADIRRIEAHLMTIQVSGEI